MAEIFLIRKGGYYYRPNARGYTASVHEAGRFPKEEAFAHMDACAPGEIVIFPAPTISVSITVEDDIRVTAEKIVLEHVASGSLNMDNLAGAIAGALEEERAKANTPSPVQHVALQDGTDWTEVCSAMTAKLQADDSAPAPEKPVDRDRLIGNLLDRWEMTPNDLKEEMREHGCGKQLDALLQTPPPSTQTMDDIHREQLDRPRLKPASPQTNVAPDAAARLERILRLGRSMKWTVDGAPALQDEDTAVAVGELFQIFFQDAVDRALATTEGQDNG